jgi:hypothetical protein
MPDRRVLEIREFDRADAHGSAEPNLDRDGESEFAMGQRPLSPWAPYPPRHAQPGIHEYTAQTLADG